jgi:hypothetical protein
LAGAALIRVVERMAAPVKSARERDLKFEIFMGDVSLLAIQDASP